MTTHGDDGCPRLKYSKASTFYRDARHTFFSDNDVMLERAEKLGKLYAEQPRRQRCKICGSSLPEAPDLRQHWVTYVFCSECRHLNGSHEDTGEFVKALYIAGDGRGYAANYLDKQFAKRVEDIYKPKLDFLVGNLPSGPDSLLDIGCGGGHFVYAALKAGIAARGIDVSKSMIDYGNENIFRLCGTRPLELCAERGLFQRVSESAATVITAIGVIEHLRTPDLFFEEFIRCRSEFIFYSVPMFSMSVLFENIFPDVFPRQLSGGHTHLFTEASVRRMNQILGVRPLAEWRFGTDVMDLYRSLSVLLGKGGASALVLESLGGQFGTIVDDMQAVLDRRHFCSEIHVLARKI